MKRTFFSIIILMSVLLAACSPAQTQNAGNVQPTSETAGTTPATSGAGELQPTKSADRWTLTYNRSGGLAGIDETLVVRSEGTVFDKQGQKVAADESKLSALVAEINQVDFSKFQADTSKGSRCNDCFITKLTFEKGGVTQTIVMVDDGSTQIPDELQSILLKIVEIVPTR